MLDNEFQKNITVKAIECPLMNFDIRLQFFNRSLGNYR